MADIVIKTEHLSKSYLIGHHRPVARRYVALRDVLARSARNLARKTQDLLTGRAVVEGDEVEEFWALKDVNFEVREGEVLGIIGRNGAGKSTLLKVLSRITEPTEGRITIRGRVASLLEVGTGFHPELTGRENIYLNGAILGMARAEIRRKFDEIVSFAEVERFLDTPVKRYSSGMYVRLAFAVAAHLEPDILVVDEVLAVGDAEFQKKCLGKMGEVSRGGRTILFVSHNMGAVQSLCPNAILIERGRITFAGRSKETVEFYGRNSAPQAEVQDNATWVRTGSGEAQIVSVRFEDGEGNLQTIYRMGEPLVIVVRSFFAKEIDNPIFEVNILTDTGIMVADCRSAHYGIKNGKTHGMVECRVRIESLSLYPRNYTIEPWVTDFSGIATHDWVRNAAEFTVISSPQFLSGANVSKDHGISFIPSAWLVNQLETIEQ